MSEVNVRSKPRQPFTRRLLALLSSMDLAITLLLVLAVASIIGTVLQQNQPYADYIIRFGPFWFEVFETAGLYDVYSALWFLVILTLLVISTTVCVTRNAPTMMKEMWQLRTNIREKSLRVMHHNDQWSVSLEQEQTAERLQAGFSEAGFRVRQTEKKEGLLLSGMKGALNRLGYLFTHIAIVVICVGGLLDSNLRIKFAEWRGDLKVETRDLASNDVPQKSRLPIGNQAFKGSIQIPEGRVANVVFLPLRDGYLVQELPFTLKVDDFRIEHYKTGQPKSFETDLVLFDDDLSEPIRTTISVNHPLIHKGYAIYQSSFADGGSGLTMEAWPLDERAGVAPEKFEGKVFEKQQMTWGDKQLRLELDSFRPFNINPDPTEEDPKNVRNFGPSFGFKLRSPTGEAKEYVNYMAPVMREGRAFFLSGVRDSVAEDFGYLYLPMDRQGSLKEFNQYLKRLRDTEAIEMVAEQMTLETLAQMTDADSLPLQTSLQDTLQTLVAMFIRGGFTEVNNFIETSLPEGQREKLGPAYLSMLREMLARLYFMDKDQSKPVTEAELLFLQDAADAIGSLSRYGSPVYLSLVNYDHVEASGLQIAKSPGKATVYIGCALLIIGVFILFYLPQIRFWALIKQNNDESEIILAGMSNRNPRDFDMLFDQIREKLRLATGNSNSK
ncbi:MAG: cytochrome c biogenesis protein [Methylophagaceae bacterium]|jgi:cytochrome c biogenesis protein